MAWRVRALCGAVGRYLSDGIVERFDVDEEDTCSANAMPAVGSGQWVVGSGQLGSGQLAVGSGQLAAGAGQWATGSWHCLYVATGCLHLGIV
jgi:X-X-X-Leu-X-X-Gly heptad repeat protein